MSGTRIDGSAKLAFGLAVSLAVIATWADSAPLGWVLGPIVVLLSWFAMSKVPMRTTLLVLMFFAFVLENPNEAPAAGAWKSPFFMFGAFMFMHLNRSTGIGFLMFSGMELMLISLGITWFMRKNSGSRVDRIGWVPVPKPLKTLAWVSWGGAALAWFSGVILRGGDGGMSMWQLEKVIWFPYLFFLFQAAIRGVEDHWALARVVLWAAGIRALMAVYVQWTVDLAPDPNTGIRELLPYGTSHHDSMLFAWAAVILLGLLLQRMGPRATKLVLYLAPVIVAGMIANQRRMVWLQIIIVFLSLYFATPPNPTKRKIARILKIASPLIAIYIAVGWNIKSPIFKPVQTIRSAVDSDVDASTLWRDIENYDLIYTIRANPVFGTGYGHGFIEVQPLPAVDYVLERFIPHNSILGLWTYTGYIGYTCMTLIWVAGAYFAMRAYHAAKVPAEKVAALACFGPIPIYYIQCYGDMGLGSVGGVFMLASSISVAGKLAVSTGAWPVTAPARRAAAAVRPPSERPAAAAS